MEQNNTGSRGDRARCWQQGLGTSGTETPGGSEQLLPRHFGAASGLETLLFTPFRGSTWGRAIKQTAASF